MTNNCVWMKTQQFVGWKGAKLAETVPKGVMNRWKMTPNFIRILPIDFMIETMYDLVKNHVISSRVDTETVLKQISFYSFGHQFNNFILFVHLKFKILNFLFTLWGWKILLYYADLYVMLTLAGWYIMTIHSLHIHCVKWKG